MRMAAVQPASRSFLLNVSLFLIDSTPSGSGLPYKFSLDSNLTQNQAIWQYSVKEQFCQ